MPRLSGTRDIVLSAVNSMAYPMSRDSIAELVRGEYQHNVTDETVFKWLGNLTRQSRIVRIGPGMYCSHEVARRMREEETIG